ncbi:hypothetical protein T4D_10565 [Trichinella pseudospiralis]|uniref:Uncharacterized protein n=1 Tax=Trichinella pseudospiralis TaxID=6337 RepID=A0A0V1G1H2_TRIPS|nr:hypothetical protein T4D_10565 [Trichinella pseudospiralis]
METEFFVNFTEDDRIKQKIALLSQSLITLRHFRRNHILLLNRIICDDCIDSARSNKSAKSELLFSKWYKINANKIFNLRK